MATDKEIFQEYFDRWVDLVWKELLSDLKYEAKYGGIFIKLKFPEKDVDKQKQSVIVVKR